MDKIKITKMWNERYFTPMGDRSFKLSKTEFEMARMIHGYFIRVMDLFPDNEFFRDMGLLIDLDVAYYTRRGRVIPEMSDLYFGRPVKLTNPLHQSFFGEWFSYSVGAMQVTTEGPVKLFDIFKTVTFMGRKGQLRLFGDVSYQEGGRLPEPTLYIANRKDFYYYINFVRRYFKIHYTTSYNGGVTVVRYLPRELGQAGKDKKATIPDDESEAVVRHPKKLGQGGSSKAKKATIPDDDSED